MGMHNSVQCLLLAFFLTLSVVFLTSYAQLRNTVQPEVTILQGTLQGITLTTNRNKNNISGFLGIPYGQSTGGNLRFSSPVSAGGWNGTRDASVDGNLCPQLSEGKVVGDEDCLYLNVFSPEIPETTNTSLLPVMVYFHGGAFKTGGSRSENHNPMYLLDKNVVLVVPNYRLGPLGFLSTGDKVASGNWGLKDQILALNWVQDNIEYFGGDPDQVTIFGVSAGSASVHFLTLSNLTTGLFHRYITESGSALSTWAYQPSQSYASRASELGEYVGCTNDTSDALIDCLRSVDFSDIIATHSKFIIWGSWPGIVWSPTDEPDVEGAVLTDSPANLFARGEIRDLPWICGVVREDGLLHTAEFQTDGEFFNGFLERIDYILPEMLSLNYQSDSGTAWVKAMKSYYFNDDLTANTSVLLANLTTLVSDALFFYPAYNAVKQQFLMAKSPQYFYTFDYRGTYSHTYMTSGSTENYGVAHADDILYLFSPDSKFSAYNKTTSETDLEIVDIIVQLWTSFATNGTPTISNSNGTTIWEQYSPEDTYLQIGNESEVALTFGNSYLKARMEFWAELEANLTAEQVSDESSAVTFPSNSFLVLLVVCSRLAYL